MKITHKLLATVSFFALAMLVLLATLTLSTMRVNDRVQSITEQTLVVMNHLIAISTKANTLTTHFERDHALTYASSLSAQPDAVRVSTPEHVQQLESDIEDFQASLNAYSHAVDAYFPEETDLRDVIVTDANALIGTVQWLAAAYSVQDGVVASQMADKQSALYHQCAALENAINAASLNEQSEITDRLNNVRDAIKNTNMSIWVGFFALAMIVTMISIFITRQIVVRIASLRSAVQKVGAGDLTVYVDNTSNDEIGELAVSFNTMAKQLADTMARRDAAKKELRAFNARLETLVRSRTEDFLHAKEKAESANRAKTKFLSSMSHELRTPLNAIMGFTQMIGLEGIREKDRNEYASIILDNSRLLLSEIDQLLVLSKLSDAEIEVAVERHPVALHEALNTAITQATHLARGYGVKLINKTDRETMPWVLAREEHLNAIISNILSNAIKYNRPENAKVVITNQQISEHTHRLIIEDTGTGFTEDLPGQVLDPFERLNRTGGPIDGTGVGLTIVNSFLALIHGTLGYESTPGSGSRFWIDLEITPPPT